MISFLRSAVLIFIFTLILSPGWPNETPTQNNKVFKLQADTPLPCNLIVRFEESVNLSEAEDLLRKKGIEIRYIYQSVFKGAALSLKKKEEIEFLLGLHPKKFSYPITFFPDHRMSLFNDSPSEKSIFEGSSPSVHVSGSSFSQVVPASIERVGASPGEIPYTGRGVGVALIDTGLDYSHRDLDLDSPVPGLNCFTSTPDGSCQDSLAEGGHGTHVGGLIAALNNDYDTVGVAPDAKLYVAKIEGKFESLESQILAGMEWLYVQADLLDPPVKVINISAACNVVLNSDTCVDSELLQVSVTKFYRRNIAVVASAGNNPVADVSLHIPARIPRVISVANSTAQEGFTVSPCESPRNGSPTLKDMASFTATVGNGVTLSAPGTEREDLMFNEGLEKCFLNSIGVESLKSGGGVKRDSGSSMSAPIVTGIVALMHEKANENGCVLTVSEITDILKSTSILISDAPLDNPFLSFLGYRDPSPYDQVKEGIVSAVNAVQATCNSK